jgi:16S rRNA (cytidine1402-2'-O)-methyltransferase
VSGPALYVVATPLGHLGDLSQRAADVLRRVAVVAAEDTRRTRVLLHHVGAAPELLSFHAHSTDTRVAALLKRLEQGGDVALVTDAGTPGVSDPGGVLVAAARAGGFPVIPVPGPSAVAAALSVSGLPADRYVFLGFPPRRGPERRRLLAQAVMSPWTVVFFEAANRLVALLDDLAAAGDDARQVVVARELTKVHEEVRAGTLHDLAVYYREHGARGEVTLVLAGRGAPASASVPVSPEAVHARARALLGEGVTRRDAAQRLAAEFGLPRNEAYRMVQDS